MLTKGVPEHIRSDNGAEMTSRIVQNWLARLVSKPLYIEPGSPWENGYCESFNGKLRDECLRGALKIVVADPLCRTLCRSDKIAPD